VNIEHIAPGLTRVQLTTAIDPDDDIAGLVLVVSEATATVRVKWDDGSVDWHRAEYLCREGERPDREPSDADIERDCERTYDMNAREQRIREGRE
jgi:hypothetical protein